MAVLSMPMVLFASASSPRKLFRLVVSQPSSQTARAGGENASNALAKAKRTKPYRKSDGLVEFLVNKVLIFIKHPFSFPRSVSYSTGGPNEGNKLLEKRPSSLRPRFLNRPEELYSSYRPIRKKT